MMGPSAKPDSSTQVVPVISPLPLREYQPAKQGSSKLLSPRGRIAVTPVRMGPFPRTNFSEPSIIVVCPTCTPATSVIALKGPGFPSNGMPKSRARGFDPAFRNDRIRMDRKRFFMVSPVILLKIKRDQYIDFRI
jgi:hypothetical protein